MSNCCVYIYSSYITCFSCKGRLRQSLKSYKRPWKCDDLLFILSHVLSHSFSLSLSLPHLHSASLLLIPRSTSPPLARPASRVSSNRLFPRPVCPCFSSSPSVSPTAAPPSDPLGTFNPPLPFSHVDDTAAPLSLSRSLSHLHHRLYCFSMNEPNCN